jgi:outer membrane biogenesis lipoprotein LolB
MKSLPCAALALLLTACTAQVSHPTKSLTEQQVDVDQCTREANHKYWMDPVAALLNAYDCLGARGYKKERSGLEARVERAAGEDRVRRKNRGEPQEPCAVPCRR